MQAELELVKQMSEIGITLRRDENGDLTVLPAPKNLDFGQLAKDLKTLANREKDLTRKDTREPEEPH